MPKSLLLLLAALPALAQLRWTQLPTGQIELTENGRPYLTYNAGPQLAPAAPADRRRCCYIYPIFTATGVNPLDDFPADHFHHRGIFWAWPVVETPSSKSDLWLLRNIEVRLESIEHIAATKSAATLKVHNAWFVEGGKILTESVQITARPTTGHVREFQIDLILAAIAEPVTLKGSQEPGKSYGGLSARFAPRTQTQIRTNAGPQPKDQDLNPYQWAELSALYNGQPATLRITPDPATPHQWCLRNYGFLGASFPGRRGPVNSFTLQIGQPLALSYTLTLTAK